MNSATIEQWRERLTAAARSRWPESRLPELANAIESAARVLARLDAVHLAPDQGPDSVVPIGSANHG
ncbi:MAG: hypothetical protein ACRDIY_12775 [Chloroflexota bacterium]